MIEFLKAKKRTIATGAIFFGLAIVVFLFADNMAHVNSKRLSATIAENAVTDVSGASDASSSDTAPVIGSIGEIGSALTQGVDSSSVAIDNAAPIASTTDAVAQPEALAPAPIPASPAAPAPAPAPASSPTQSSVFPDAGVPQATSTDASATITVTPTVTTHPILENNSQTQASTQQNPQVAGAFAFDESNFTNDDSWRMVWGQKEVGVDGFLHLSAGAGSLGGSVYLKNSLAWANYSFAAKFNWPTGQTVDLMGNYVNASNYVVCEYQRSGPGMVAMRLVQYRGGEDIQLTPDVAVGVTNYDDLNASITLNGAKGICALNGYTSSNAKIGSGVYPIDPVTGGGIGFAMRDPQADINQLIVKNISVRSTP